MSFEQSNADGIGSNPSQEEIARALELPEDTKFPPRKEWAKKLGLPEHSTYNEIIGRVKDLGEDDPYGIKELKVVPKVEVSGKNPALIESLPEIIEFLRQYQLFIIRTTENHRDKRDAITYRIQANLISMIFDNPGKFNIFDNDTLGLRIRYEEHYKEKVFGPHFYEAVAGLRKEIEHRWQDYGKHDNPDAQAN